MENQKLTIAVVCYNSMSFLEKCFSSLEKIDYQNFEILMIDQGSKDDSVEFVKKSFPSVRVIENTNTGYAGGANKAFYESDGEFLVIQNPDVEVEANYFSILIKKLNNDQKIAAITGKIIKPKIEIGVNIIDTTGLMIFKNRRVVDRGQGLEDSDYFSKECEVFGISGCLALYRRSALKNIEITIENKPEVWDNDFFMYKEDVDVSWRLNLNGWKCVYDPTALAFHARGTGILKRYTNLEILKHRQSVPALAKFFSYRNQRLMQVKNEIFTDFIIDLPVIFVKELATLSYLVIFEFRNLKSFFSFFRLLPRALKKRKIIQNGRAAHTMKTWIKGSPKDAFKQ